jgi:hypothetical protein
VTAPLLWEELFALPADVQAEMLADEARRDLEHVPVARRPPGRPRKDRSAER